MPRLPVRHTRDSSSFDRHYNSLAMLKSGVLPPILEVRNLTKAFPGALALDAVTLTVFPGEVHVLSGENGAGKSTLLRILAGVYQPDQGEIRFRGTAVRIANPQQALKLGIITLYQELNLVGALSVAENIFLGREQTLWGFIDRRTMSSYAKTLLKAVALEIDPATPVSELGIAQRQLVEIAKALSQVFTITRRSTGEAIIDFSANASHGVLTMDEPTAALSNHEVAVLHELILRLKSYNLAIIYISHRLKELRSIGDRITVLRDGKTVASGPLDTMTDDQLVHFMVGRNLSDTHPPRQVTLGPERLRVVNLSNRSVKNISFAVRAGEIIGIFGLVGAGRTELLRAIFGLAAWRSGQLLVDGKMRRVQNPREAISTGIGLLPEDRKAQGLALLRSVRENITAASLERFTFLGFIRRYLERQKAEELVKELGIRPPKLEQLSCNLSGGNQ
ncbi:MAG: sugar ABC transporter ATP-binding protein, partial [Cyanobacteria bacterium NC_groundwater_1444_Ag_S-0.65um_54_12]|nr:sugar ABC transporter ATP-binding protein [Cyanobacteria bacterium NC_groundwater_1444_Ag_S-0.65um_54_12]